MTGLLLIAFVAAWLAIVVAMTRWAARRFRSTVSKVASAIVVGPVLLAAPLADELIGKQQFEALCKQDGRPKQADLESARGSTLRVRLEPFKPVADMVLETQAAMYTYSDVQSGKPILIFHTYRTKGGWLIRMLALSETNAPLTFSSECRSPHGESLQDSFDRYQIKPVFNR